MDNRLQYLQGQPSRAPSDKNTSLGKKRCDGEPLDDIYRNMDQFDWNEQLDNNLKPSKIHRFSKFAQHQISHLSSVQWISPIQNLAPSDKISGRVLFRGLDGYNSYPTSFFADQR